MEHQLELCLEVARIIAAAPQRHPGLMPLLFLTNSGQVFKQRRLCEDALQADLTNRVATVNTPVAVTCCGSNLDAVRRGFDGARAHALGDEPCIHDQPFAHCPFRQPCLAHNNP